jgi:small subunit ribosomal protein S21
LVKRRIEANWIAVTSKSACSRPEETRRHSHPHHRNETPVRLAACRISQPSEEFPLQVLVRDNNIDQALRILKRKMQREGVFREMKQRRSYEKPSGEKRAKSPRPFAGPASSLGSKRSGKDCCQRLRRRSFRSTSRLPQVTSNERV